MAAEAERGVDHRRSLVPECGRQKSDDPVEEDRDVAGAAHGRALPAQAREDEERRGQAERGRRREGHHRGRLPGLVTHPAYRCHWRDAHEFDPVVCCCAKLREMW
ncbi:hypothetical protein NLS1_37130 [Nocardioides sp. LS1]|nr:hypothetical protein NLS1_37130 [Nocardioides sp. LS1]